MLIAFFGIAFGLPIFIIIYSIRLIDTGSPFFYQERVGKNMKGFMLVKFRTMAKGTASVTSPLVNPNAITKIGVFYVKLNWMNYRNYRMFYVRK